MAVTVTQSPQYLKPAYSDNVLTVSSNQVASKFKFKYVFDLFGKTNDEGAYTYLGRVRQTPNPSGVGMLDLGRYLENVVSQDLFGGQMYDLAWDYPYELQKTIGQYYIMCGEEYSTSLSGSTVLYNGSGTVSSTSTLTGTTTGVKVTFNGVNQFEYGYFWPGNQFFISTNRSILSTQPLIQYREADEPICLAVLAGDNQQSFDANISRLGYTAKFYFTDGTNATYTQDFGTYTASTVTGFYTSGTLQSILDVNSQTKDWTRVELSFSTEYEKRIIYKKNCPWQKYEPKDVIFLNRYGAWDTFRFYGSKDEVTKITRGTYEVPYGTWAGDSYSYNTWERGTTNISTELQVEGDMMSDFLERDTVNWLGELLTSPQVYLVANNELPHIITGGVQLLPINITSSDFKKQIKGNVKLRQVSFKYKYSTPTRTQQQ
jgi:hypothetical protein